MNKSALTNLIKKEALALGLSKVGVAKAEVLPKSHHLNQWLAEERHGTMAWMENYLEKRLDITKLYPEAQSVVSVALNYYSPQQHSADKATGKISRYAWGEKDYHTVLKKRLKQLLRQLKEQVPGLEGRLFVDTAPIQDKLWAEAAGIGWQGKHTNIITREMGSWVFLGELLLNQELEYDIPVKDFCGNCSACIDACPTQALEPYKIDGSKCISYLTIEMWDKPIPEEQANKLNNWIFGCDICQDVCPWNKFEQPTEEEAFQPVTENIAPKLNLLAQLSAEDFRKRFKKSPVYRAKHSNFLRNVNTVIKNNK